MSTHESHYDELLAPIYTWMAGGTDTAFEQGLADIQALLPAGVLAVDLGAGFGSHAIPLARLGWRVVAIDSSPLLLAQLAEAARGLAVSTHGGDLLRFADHLAPGERPALILCMGDTLTHLPRPVAVDALITQVARKLAPGGRFVATFRDYTQPPQGERRFIPVRADDQRILTCFLEDAGDHVLVHDLLHERVGGRWEMKLSSYPKLKLQPLTLVAACAAQGLHATVEQGPRGMVRLLADQALR
jgi:SAM-dependent methyltransferase